MITHALYATIWSLLPSILVIIVAISTRRVLLALMIGIFSGAILLHINDPLAAPLYILQQLISLFWDNGWQLDKLYIMAFLLLLGMMAAFITMSGGTAAFGHWILNHVKSRRGAKLSTMLLGLVIFIDDYFNNLAVGNICRPMTDKHRIPRTQLAYIIDSTAAPICVLAPLSSWGAYIIALLTPILATHHMLDYSALMYFIYLLPMNFYAFFALILVFISAYFNWNIGAMRLHEQLALKTGELGAITGPVPSHDPSMLDHLRQGQVSDLILPFAALIFGTFAAMFISGYVTAVGKAVAISPLVLVEHTQSQLSLAIGSLLGLTVIITRSLHKKLTVSDYLKTSWIGIQSMLPAIYILLLAWLVISIISSLGTGQYLASQLDNFIQPRWLPFLLFIVAGIMAFCTGTSWGTFSIMLPIAADITAAIEISQMLPALAAVLAGAVFGDHCSPISDTTILASTGANCDHVDHFITQLPYGLIAGAASSIAFILLGFTQSLLLALSSLLVSALGVILYIKKFDRN